MKQAQAEVVKEKISPLCYTPATKNISGTFQQFDSYNAPSMQHLMDHALNMKAEKLFSARDYHTQTCVSPGNLEVSKSEF